MGDCGHFNRRLNIEDMRKLDIRSIGRYFNVQKIAALFFVLLILTAYSITIGQNNPLDVQKEKIVNMVKNQQEKGITTLAITSLPFWLALSDKFSNEDP